MLPRIYSDSRVWLTHSATHRIGKQFWRVILALGLVLGLNFWSPLLRPQAVGINYYVNSSLGSDSNPGTSPDRPWRSLAPVNAHSFLPGDLINLARGSSWSGGLVINSSGVQGNPITFQAYGTGARPTISNSGRWSRSISINGSWIVVKGVMVRDAQEFGVRIAQGANHNQVSDVEATAVGIGFGIYGQYNIISRNHVHDLKMVTNTSGGDDDYGAYAFGLYNSYNEISYNRMERCKAPSYDYGQDGGAFEFYNNVAGSYIHHNWANDNNGFIEVGGGSATDTRVAYNVAVNNGTFAWFHLSGNFASDVNNFRVENNTIVETAVSNNTYEVFGFSASPGASTLILRNNIFYVNQYQYLSSKAGYTHDHNVYRFLQSYTKLPSPLGTGEKLADPLFANLGGGDYHLRSGSPAIDAGANLGYSADYDGRAVPSGAAPDAGSFEYAAPAAPTATATKAPPTPTATRVPPTPTAVQPTRTATAVPPTPTRTATAVPPTPTRTATVVPPTPTRTSTVVPPTSTPTATRVPPGWRHKRNKHYLDYIFKRGWASPLWIPYGCWLIINGGR